MTQLKHHETTHYETFLLAQPLAVDIKNFKEKKKQQPQSKANWGSKST